MHCNSASWNARNRSRGFVVEEKDIRFKNSLDCNHKIVEHCWYVCRSDWHVYWYWLNSKRVNSHESRQRNVTLWQKKIVLVNSPRNTRWMRSSVSHNLFGHCRFVSSLCNALTWARILASLITRAVQKHASWRPRYREVCLSLEA